MVSFLTVYDIDLSAISLVFHAAFTSVVHTALHIADTSAIIAKKQALRDAPADSAIDAATDEAGLKAQWNTSILGTSPYS